MIPLLAFAAGLAVGVVIGLHAVYRQSGAPEPFVEPYGEPDFV